MAKHARVEFEGNDGSEGETVFARAAQAISEKTSVSFKILIPTCSLIICSTWLISQSIGRLERRLEESWYISDMERWSRAFKRENPAIILPDAREVFDQNTDRKVKLTR